MPEAEILGQIHLNITALTELTRLCLPPMVAAPQRPYHERRVHRGIPAGPLMAVYYATKAYVISFSEAIANELRDSGITVTCFCPGATHTGFAKRADTEKSRVFKQFGAMSAEKVALDGYRALMEGRTVVDQRRAKLAGRTVHCVSLHENWSPPSPAGSRKKSSSQDRGHENTQASLRIPVSSVVKALSRPRHHAITLALRLRLQTTQLPRQSYCHLTPETLPPWQSHPARPSDPGARSKSGTTSVPGAPPRCLPTHQGSES